MRCALITRSFKSRFFAALALSALGLATLTLLSLLGLIVIKGAGAINLDFLTQSSRSFGASGGISDQIIGSLLMVVIAGLLVLPVSLGLALYMSEIIKSARARRAAKTILLTLNTVPSITFGIFGLVFFVTILGTGISWFVGSIILAFMMLPTVTLASYQSLNAIPSIYRENGYSLGFTQSQTFTHILIPQSFHGTVTGLLIGLARAVGETAPIMFVATAFSGVGFPSALHEPVSTLPTHILALAQQATNPEVVANAWGAALVLILIVMGFSLAGQTLRILRRKELSL